MHELEHVRQSRAARARDAMSSNSGTGPGTRSGAQWRPPSGSGNRTASLAQPRQQATKKVVVAERQSNRRYLRGKLLGRGGFAAVYELREIPQGASKPRSNGKRWAGKVVAKKKIMESVTKRQQLETEISIHREMEHPHVLKFLGMFEDQDDKGLWMRLEVSDKLPISEQSYIKALAHHGAL
eukprot:SAG11_NODE_3096_length_2698_cov_1.560215_3_plen_182_part_00